MNQSKEEVLENAGWKVGNASDFLGMTLTESILVEANVMRAKKDCRPFLRDERLEKAAQEHANDLAAGRARPHDGMEERIRRAGFPVSYDSCKISRKGMGANYTEGIVNGSDEVSPKYLEYLTSSGPGEGHYDDFYDPKITRVGIGVASGHLVLDYGIDCEADLWE